MNEKHDPSLMISKLDAARRQLDTAIALWFDEHDPVSTHTLAYAAYEIVHTISKKRNPDRRDLLFDSTLIKEEFRADYNRFIKSHANFFKHGDRDGEAVIEFRPALTGMFILFSIIGLEECGERKSDPESAYLWWLSLHKPVWVAEGFRKIIADNFKPKEIAYLRQLSKREFFQNFLHAMR